MSINLDNLKPKDVFRNSNGRLFELVGIWTQPVIDMRELHSDGTIGERLLGGINGCMWDGFIKLEPPA